MSQDRLNTLGLLYMTSRKNNFQEIPQIFTTSKDQFAIYSVLIGFIKYFIVTIFYLLTMFLLGT